MRCQRCGLPDPYRGQGDGIGSCECPRCDCCEAAPDECECAMDWDEFMDDPEDELNGAFDPLCNDSACPTHRARMERAKK